MRTNKKLLQLRNTTILIVLFELEQKARESSWGGTLSVLFLHSLGLRPLGSRDRVDLGQSPGGEIVSQPMNLHIFTPSPRVLDRLGFGDVLDLPFHILPHHEGERFRRFQ